MSFLVDTDICSAHLKHGGKVSNRFLQYTGGLHISTIKLGELSTWAHRGGAPPKRLQALREMLDDLKILEVTSQVAEKFGEVQAGLLDVGKPAAAMDLMIAATALVHDLTLGDAQHPGLYEHSRFAACGLALALEFRAWNDR